MISEIVTRLLDILGKGDILQSTGSRYQPNTRGDDGMKGWIEAFNLHLRLLTCAHAPLSPDEGKYYCPDCGRGLIYQWIVLRCATCNTRLESRMGFHTLKPAKRFCPRCGNTGFQPQILEAPGYFQLEKAWLMQWDEANYLKSLFRSVLEKLDHLAGGTLQNACVWTFVWLDPSSSGSSRRLLPLEGTTAQ